MAISEFQLALAGAGVFAVAAVWSYNAWQEYRVRKTASEMFAGEQQDILEDSKPSDVAAGDRTAVTGARIEPVFAPPIGEAQDNMIEARDDASDSQQVTNAPESDAAAIDLSMIDPMVEFCLALPAHAGISALRNAWRNASKVDHGKAIRWLACAVENGDWIELGEVADLRANDVRVAIQLADRQGAISLDELKVFCYTAESVIIGFGGDAPGVESDALEEVARHALAVDELCASVDIQIAIHIISRSGQDFPNSKLKGMLEAAGLQLALDGLFYLLDAEGNRMLSVCNSGAVPFDLEQMRTGSVGDITFWLDVPKVINGGNAYDTMVATARQLAEALEGVLVDDQRMPLADNVLTGIRAKVIELQNIMAAHEIPAGGRRALRLFA